jgi:hypothetical protein
LCYKQVKRPDTLPQSGTDKLNANNFSAIFVSRQAFAMPSSTSPLHRIAISTGGGDAPGLNAVIRAATLSALQRGWEVVGIVDTVHSDAV